MIHTSDPLTHWALSVLISVVLGTFALIAVAFIRRWQQVRYARYIHELQKSYRPILAKLLRGQQRPTGIEAMRELPLGEVEILLDPLLCKRKLTPRQLVFLQALCAELGLITLWQNRVTNGREPAARVQSDEVQEAASDPALVRHLLRAKSIRNLGRLRHHPSWRVLVDAIHDRHRDIQSVALRSLASLGATESFPVLRDQLHAVMEEDSPSVPLSALQAAMVSFDLGCAPALAPSLIHPNERLRLHATEILRTMVYRRAADLPDLALTPEPLTPEMVDSLLNCLITDACAEIRARVAEITGIPCGPSRASTLHKLLLDHEWFVRLRTVRALAHWRHAAAPMQWDIRARLRDSHWRVREAAILTLLSLGRSGKRQLYESFLTSPDPAAHTQIVEVLERTGLISTLVEEYSAGNKGLTALVVEQLASEAAPRGLVASLGTLSPEIRQKFLERFVAYADSHARFLHEPHPLVERTVVPHRNLHYPRILAA